MAITPVASTIGASASALRSPFLERASKPVQSPRTREKEREALQVYTYQDPFRARHDDRTPEILRINNRDSGVEAASPFREAGSVNDVIQRAKIRRAFEVPATSQEDLDLSPPAIQTDKTEDDAPTAEEEEEEEKGLRVNIEAKTPEAAKAERPEETGRPERKTPAVDLTASTPENTGTRVNFTV